MQLRQCFREMTGIISIVVQVRADSYAVFLTTDRRVVRAQVANQIGWFQFRMAEGQDARLSRPWPGIAEQTS